MAEFRTHVLRTERGDLWVEDAGPEAGFPLLVQSGSPGSRRLFRPDAELAARAYGLRLIGHDRPGYGTRPPRPGRSIADGAEETRLIADRLGLDRFAVWGVSGGGPYALACAALLPDRVVAACVLASPAPYGGEEWDYCAGWPDAHREEVRLFFDQPDVAREHWRADAERLYAALSTPEGWLARWGAAAEPDAAHGRAVAEHLAAEQRDCLAQGDQGWWDDWAAVLGPWGFDLADIRVPVQLWHGERDTAVPPGHGRRLAARIPGVDAHFTTDDHATIEAGHLRDGYAWIRCHIP